MALACSRKSLSLSLQRPHPKSGIHLRRSLQTVLTARDHSSENPLAMESVGPALATNPKSRKHSSEEDMTKTTQSLWMLGALALALSAAPLYAQSDTQSPNTPQSQQQQQPDQTQPAQPPAGQSGNDAQASSPLMMARPSAARSQSQARSMFCKTPVGKPTTLTIRKR